MSLLASALTSEHSAPLDSTVHGMKLLKILCLPGPQDRELLVMKFAAWMGIESRIITVDEDVDPILQIEGWSLNNACLAITADTLAILHRRSSDPDRFRHVLIEHCAELLVFACDEPAHQSAALVWLSAGAVNGICSPVQRGSILQRFGITESSREFSRQFAGLDFDLSLKSAPPGFELNGEISAVKKIMAAGDRSVCLCVAMPSCRLFLIAGSETPNIDEPISRQNELESKYPLLIPFLIFFRSVFESESWRSPTSTAMLVIDDPLLGDRYGFLDYGHLSKSMNRERYGTTIAFIPWNYRRTSRTWSRQVLQERTNLSVCVHGCDHSNREFETSDQKVLVQKAGIALERMEKHRERTAMRFEPVMVFPQGRFSKGAIFALRTTQYLAAVNTSGFAFDANAGELRVRDFLRPAITHYFGFPIFLRRYPKRAIDFAFDIFVGKPAILVEHHEYFADGCKALEDFVQGLYRIEPGLSWPNLSTQLTQRCLIKCRRDKSLDLYFFTKKFQLTHRGQERGRYCLRKDEPDPSIVRTVMFNGASIPFECKDGGIEFEIEADPGETVTIDVGDRFPSTQKFKGFGVRYNAGVFIRRRLSEFRDNTLSRHPDVLRAAEKVARGLKVTGE